LILPFDRYGGEGVANNVGVVYREWVVVKDEIINIDSD
jgi:hypothetical protein